MSSLAGTSLSSVLRNFNPSFIWDANRAGSSSGLGIAGKSISWTITDMDSVTPPDNFSVWSEGKERFEVIDPTTYPDKILGPVGDFSDGVIRNYWSSSWLTSNLGFSVTSPTGSSMLGQVSGVPADIINGGSLPDVTYVDTDEVQDSVIERSNSRSSTYQRVFQILIKSEDGNDPNGNVEIGMNTTSGTRVTDASGTWFRQLPGSKGWYSALYIAGSGSTIYITMKFKLGTGRWFLSSPMFYNQFSTFENITRAPIPRYSSTTERGQYGLNTTNTDFAIPRSGWMAGSFVLPDRSVSNGHSDYAGASNYGFAGLMSWQSGTYRIRMIMSDSQDHIAVQLDNGGTSFAFLDFTSDWSDFEGFGFVVTWGYTNGSEYANLYVNGVKQDSVFGTSDWFPQNLSSSDIYIGSNGSGGAAADCWISRLIIGRNPMDRSTAKVLSYRMKELVRGAV